MPYKSIFRRCTVPFAVTALAGAVLASAPGPGQRTFATPREAARALRVAAESDDMPALTRIFGPQADEILDSGDAVADRNNRARFVKKAKQSMKEKIDPANANRASLFIGAD